MPLDMVFEPWVVGDISTIGFVHELMEEKVTNAIGYTKQHYGTQVHLQDFEYVLELFEIRYKELPKYLKNEIDREIDIIV